MRTSLLLIVLLISSLGHAQNLQNLLVNPGNNLGSTEGWTQDNPFGGSWFNSNGINGGSAWASSPVWNYKWQLIDLVAQGFTPAYLDSSPVIRFAQQYNKYEVPGMANDQWSITVALLDESQQEITNYSYSDFCGADGWQLFKGYFSSYPAGVRYVKFTHGGREYGESAGSAGGASLDDSFLSVGNLVLYGSANTASLSGWDVVNGGDGWSFAGNSEFVSSYDECKLSQQIDLTALGYSGGVSGDDYSINFAMDYRGVGPSFNDPVSVVLTFLNSNGDVVDATTLNGVGAEAFQELTFTYSDFANVAEVLLDISAQDIEYWLGNYGAKVSNIRLWLESQSTDSTDELEASLNESNAVLFPNPSASKFTLKCDQDMDRRAIEIRSLDGRLVRKVSPDFVNGKAATIDLSGLTSGTFYITYFVD
ncbi:MAG: hypothetical protein KDC12_03295 [Flavobacteriales bacterium]|nr:hypothetical protein [Flavobacteriales bacterium]